jgi:phospholipase A1
MYGSRAWLLAASLLVVSGMVTRAHASGLAECAVITADSQRLACFDALAASSVHGTGGGFVTEKVAPSAPATSDAGTAKSDAVISMRRREESDVLDNPFSLTAYHPNYILPVTYNSKFNEEPFEAAYPDIEGDDVEAKFQISFKAKIWDMGPRTDLWFGYTQESWWQLYNDDESAPFRETNYQPEIFLTYAADLEVFGSNLSSLSFGFNHQSNGRGEALSRSWNRLIAGALFEKGNLAIRPRIWWRIPEDKEDDDNRYTEDYYGYGDLRLAYAWGGQTLSAMLRDNLQFDDNKGAVQLDWSFPLNRRFKGYVQYFYGYGESMIDYDVKTNRLGVGIMLTDWL